jgi:hypothetical protein
MKGPAVAVNVIPEICTYQRAALRTETKTTEFSVQLDYQNPNDISEHLCYHSTQSGDTMHA